MHSRDNIKKALLVTTVSGFVPQFEMNNVHILQEMGYEIHYASNFNNVHYGSDNSRLDGTGIIRHQVDFVRSPFKLAANIRAYKQLKQVMKEEHYDMVHCHTPMGAVLARLAAKQYRKKGTKVFYTAHGFHFYKGAPLKNWLFFYPIEKWLSKYTDVLITINKEDYKCAKAFCHKTATKVEYIPGVGINVRKYNKQERSDTEREKKRESIRRKLKIDEKSLLVISVGELNVNKNHILVIKALAGIDDVCYVICGEGEQREVLLREMKRLGVEDKVKLLGYCKDVKRLLTAADVFILPSLREGLSCSLQEAMAAALPIIASDVRGNRDLIDINKGGILVNPKSVSQMQYAIKMVQKGKKEKMGEYNYCKIQDYSKEVVMKKMRKIYQMD